MFSITDTLEFTHTVPVMVPVDGGHTEQSLKVRFRIHPDADASTLDVGSDDGLKDFLLKVVVSFDDVVDQNKKPLPYNDALRDRLLAMPFVKIPVWKAYIAAVTKAKVGN